MRRYAPLDHTHSSGPGTVDWGDITGKPATFTPAAHTHPWSEITSQPTTLSGTVNLTGGQTIAGSKTFTTMPIISDAGTHAYIQMVGAGTPCGYFAANNAGEMGFVNAANSDWLMRFNASGQMVAGTIPWARLTGIPAGATYDGSDAVKLTGAQSITGAKTFSDLRAFYHRFTSFNTSGLDFRSDSSTVVGMRFKTGGDEVRGWVYANEDGIGFLNSSSGWSWRVNNSNVLEVGTVPWSRLSGGSTEHIPGAGSSLTHGSLSVGGFKNDWAGFQFSDVGNQPAFLIDSTRSGVYSVGTNWMWRWDSGVLAAGLVPAGRITGAFTRLQSDGLSTSWGVTSGVNTGGVNTVMGTGGSATWLWSGTSAGTFRAGFQVLDSGNSARLYVGAQLYNFDAGNFSFPGSLTGGSVPAARIDSGFLNTARLGSGTANSGTWLRGDGTWQALPAGAAFVGVRFHRTTTATVSNNGTLQLQFNNTDYNVGSFSNANGTITVPSTGYYRIEAGCRWDTNSTGARGLFIQRAGVTVAGTLAPAGGGTNCTYNAAVTVEITNTATQTISVDISNIASGGTRTVTPSEQSTFLSITKVG